MEPKRMNLFFFFLAAERGLEDLSSLGSGSAES